MTVENNYALSSHTVVGVGPYAIPWSYSDGAVFVLIEAAGGATDILDPANFTVTPASGVSGNVYLTPASAALHAGKALFIGRKTPVEQGWVPQLGEREVGMAAQLDEQARALQEVQRDVANTVKTTASPQTPIIPMDQRVLMWSGGRLVNGPSAQDIANAAPNAAAAAASAEQAAMFDGIWFDTFQEFGASTQLKYSGTGVLVSAGDLIFIRNPFAILEVAPANATDHVWQNSATPPVKVKAAPHAINRALLGEIYDKPIVGLWSGQSNALGGTGASTGTRATINPFLHFYEHFVGPTTTSTGWKTGGPGTPDWPFLDTGNHIAYHFFDMVQRLTGRTVLVLSHAVGGTPLAEFLPSGGGVPGATGTMWSALNNIFVAARAVPIPGRTDGATMASLGCAAADIMGWHQSEADADYRSNPANPSYDTRASTYDQYMQRFPSFIAALRDPASAGSAAAPMLKPYAPVIMGELLIGGTSGGFPTDDRNDALRALSAEQELMTCVPSAGLQSTDNLHFDGADLVEFARRYFHALGNFPKQGTKVGTNLAYEVLEQPGRVVTLTRTISLAANATQAYTFPFDLASAAYPISITHQQGGSSTSSSDIHISAVTASGLTLRNSNATIGAVFRLTIGPWKRK